MELHININTQYIIYVSLVVYFQSNQLNEAGYGRDQLQSASYTRDLQLVVLHYDQVAETRQILQIHKQYKMIRMQKEDVQILRRTRIFNARCRTCLYRNLDLDLTNSIQQTTRLLLLFFKVSLAVMAVEQSMLRMLLILQLINQISEISTYTMQGKLSKVPKSQAHKLFMKIVIQCHSHLAIRILVVVVIRYQIKSLYHDPKTQWTVVQIYQTNHLTNK